MKITTRRLIIGVAGCAVMLGVGVNLLARLKPNPRSLRLPDGTIVTLTRGPHPEPSRDSIKYLTVTRPDGRATIYPFAESHAGYKFVELRADLDSSTIWIVVFNGQKRPSDLGCSLNLKTGAFVDEGQPHPPVVGVNRGIVIEEISP